MPRVTFDAEPAPLTVELDGAALVIIDMQRDFLEPGGFGAALGNDVSLLQAAVAPCRDVLGGRAPAAACWSSIPAKAIGPTSPMRRRTRSSAAIRRSASARRGPMGRILVRGEPGHDIIPELYPPPASR